MNIKLKGYTINSIASWTMLIVSLHLLALPETTENILLKYFFIAAVIISIINLLINFDKVRRFGDYHIEKDNKYEFFAEGEIRKRSILNYLKSFPSENPNTLISIVGLLMLEHYIKYSEILYQMVSGYPILNLVYYPSLLLIILIMIFGDYCYHVRNNFIRRAMKVLTCLCSPLLLAVFILGLLSPFIIIFKGLFDIMSILHTHIITELSLFQMVLGDMSNIFWLLVYPIVLIYTSSCEYTNKYEFHEISKQELIK